MNEFRKYLKDLANHEEWKSRDYLSNPRNKILVNAGVHLNWLGDFFANPNIRWEKKKVPVKDILMTGTQPRWNDIFIKRCGRSPKKLMELISKDKDLAEEVKDFKSDIDAIILLRRKGDKYLTLDGMPRFVKQVVSGAKEVEAYIPVNEFEELPYCEPHVVYDLIRGCNRHARDEAGRNELKHALKLLIRTYGNAKRLLNERFNENYVFEEDIQKVIKIALEEADG